MLPWLSSKIAKKIAVIGDVILDEYLEGEVQRISPEAPVPIHVIKSTFLSAGGAANTARNVGLVGGEAHLFSIWGKDAAAEKLRQILQKDQVNTENILDVEDRPTIKKTRISSGHQQMLRVDSEKVQEIEEELQNKLFAGLKSQRFDAILISDYGKGSLPAGFLYKIFQYAREMSIPTVVDPKGRDFDRYRGCDFITPNRKEACDALGFELGEAPAGKELGALLQKKFSLKNVLVTLGPEGMVLIPKSQKDPIFFKNPKTREVFDVSGAGDTVAAILSLCIAADCDPSKSLEYASLAAGLVVEKWGTQPVKRVELELALQEDFGNEHGNSTFGKVKTLDSLMDRINYIRKQRNIKLVFTNGCFDLLHAGHLVYLEKAKSLGDVLIIGVNSDQSVRRLKGTSRPLVPHEQRMRLIAGLSCSDYVIGFEEETPFELISRIQPDILVKGADYREEDVIGADIVKQRGGQIHCIPLVKDLSTTSIIKKANSQFEPYDLG